MNISNTNGPNGRKLVVRAVAATADDLDLSIVETTAPPAPEGHAVVEIKAAAVNPSDVKAALGMMPNAIWPRTPGRDFAGVVVKGPDEWVGLEVWGTGGDLGITRDGTHASYLTLPLSALAHKPKSVPVPAAATVGVPFITAYEGLRRFPP